MLPFFIGNIHTNKSPEAKADIIVNLNRIDRITVTDAAEN